jgi:tRNA/rRNA methyltransferase
MGFSHFRLVNPCDHLSTEAKMLAHGSVDVLEQAQVYSSLEEALADLDLSIATTSKSRDARTKYVLNSKLPEILGSKGGTIGRVGIVFGGEDSGLSNEQIRMCDIASTIPLKRPYPSLNLSQAVMIYAYTLADMELKSGSGRVSPPGDNEFRTMMDKSKNLLAKLEMDKSPALYNRVLERIALLEEEDIHLLLSVLGRL